MTTVTVPTDYATIQEACNALAATASDANPGTVYILDGEYEEPGTYNLGLYIRNYINLVGQSRDGVIIYPPAGEADGDAVFYPGYNARHENLTLYARAANHYALHQDHYSNWITWKNCIFYHESAAKAAIGGGGRGNQVLTFEDCEVTQGTASVHGDVYSRAVSDFPWRWEFRSCILPAFGVIDFVEYKENQVLFTGCTIGTLTYTQNLTYYTANPDNPLYNRGYLPDAIHLVDGWGGNQVTTGGNLLGPFIDRRLAPLMVGSMHR